MCIVREDTESQKVTYDIADLRLIFRVCNKE